MKRTLGMAGAIALVVIIAATVALTDFSPSVDNGIWAGMTVAYFQAIVSLVVMKAALRGKKFFWVWTGSFFFRLLVFCITAFVTYTRTSMDLAATLLTLVGVTTALMTLESWAYLNKGQS